LLGERDRVLGALHAEQHAELVAAEASDQAAIADDILEQARRVAQQSVSGGVAAGVVDDLELVEIGKYQHQRSVVRLRHFAIELELELAPVGEFGERVVRGLPGDPIEQTSFFRHVADDQDAAAVARVTQLRPRN